jgi:hypothetical protein
MSRYVLMVTIALTGPAVAGWAILGCSADDPAAVGRNVSMRMRRAES